MRIQHPLLNIATVVAALFILSGCGQKQAEPQAIAEEPATTDVEQASSELGRQVYQQVCMACHDSGVMEAPKFGDAAAWSELIAEGYGILVYESIKGEGNMPPRGGNPQLTDMEVAHAVAYLANAAGADFVPPQSEEVLQAILSAAKIEVEQTHDGHEE